MSPHDQTCRICGYPQSAHTVHTLHGGAQIIEQSIVGSVIRCWGFVGVEPSASSSSHNVPAEHAMIGATLDALAAGISVEDLRDAAEDA